MNVSDKILTENINYRRSMGVTGDYLKVDMFAMKKRIEKRFYELPDDFIKYVANITNDNLAFLLTHLCT